MKPPNILLFVTDQHQRCTIGAYGSHLVKTPTLDKLAAEGLTFDRCYTGCGLCSPIRSSLFTGTYPHDHGVLTNIHLHPVRQELTPDKDILTPRLKKAGYRLGYVGKWHVANNYTPKDFGFEHYVSLGDYAAYRQKLGIPLPAEAMNYVTPVSAVDPAPVEHCRPAFLADNAIRIVNEFARDTEHPFFIRLDFHGPHLPNVIPEPYASMYSVKSIAKPSTYDEDLTGKPAVQKIKRRHWEMEDMPWEDFRHHMQKYYGEITLLDHQIGRVVDALDRLGLAEDTVIFFTADHGDTMGDHRIWNKDYTMYDQIYHIPFIARWKGTVTPGSRSPSFISQMLDLTPTLLDLSGSDTPEGLHGKSLLPLLKGEPQQRRDDAFCQFHGSHMGLYSMRMVETERYKYVFHSNDIDELYDHKTDPDETMNLAEDPDCAAVLKEMKYRMVDWLRETNDHLYNEWIVYWLTGDDQLAIEAPGRRKAKW
ncbi:MAG: sulfatase-like hydrolase/transferase [Desulfovibrionaceae bacterium]|nr:sulfatase-like hydrolase/transferase [Desulfovibrionaceae bacterium]